jgi:hypothetical protein
MVLTPDAAVLTGGTSFAPLSALFESASATPLPIAKVLPTNKTTAKDDCNARVHGLT